MLLVLLGAFAFGLRDGVAASCINFSLDVFVGRRGANQMQTPFASETGLSGMGVLMQAMVWKGLAATSRVASRALHAVHRHG
jgi:hypothetical protein